MVRTAHPFSHLFGDVNRISDEFNRLFSTPRPQSAINVWSDDNAYYAETDLPGLTPDAIEITVTDGTELTIRGERTIAEPEGASWLRQERPRGAFNRRVTLPSLVDADKVEASYENGVLKLTLPKSEAAKPRRIAVR